MERIAFVTYETPYAPCGGIAAVMGRLPPYVQRETNLPTVVITPMHHRIKKTRELTPHLERVGAATIHYENSPITVNILRLKEDVSWYFLLPDDPRFFAGKRHPYDVGQGGESAGAPLLRDALLFGSATAKTLHLLAPGDQWTVFMQDWEAATTALALTQQQAEHRLMLTFHNSYDCKADDLELLAFHINPEFCPGESVLTRCLPLVADPLTTVSGQFALDMTEELLQTKVLAPHLQEPLGRRQLLGVNNGPFVDLAVPEDVLQAAREGALDPLRQWKTGRRVDFHQALMEVRDAVRAGTVLPWETEEQPWGDLDDFLDGFDPEDDAPWFVMGGRDDSRQKGYDVAARAARDLLDQNADARFLFFPMPGDDGLEGLRFLKDLAEQQRFRKFMLVFPVRFYKGYMAALQGGTFGLMP
ncbi:MAG: glycogen/starch synthase [Planctomycetales bacterium]